MTSLALRACRVGNWLNIHFNPVSFNPGLIRFKAEVKNLIKEDFAQDLHIDMKFNFTKANRVEISATGYETNATKQYELSGRWLSYVGRVFDFAKYTYVPFTNSFYRDAESADVDKYDVWEDENMFFRGKRLLGDVLIEGGVVTAATALTGGDITLFGSIYIGYKAIQAVGREVIPGISTFFEDYLDWFHLA